MRTLRFAVAAFLGFVLYQYAVVFVGGCLAAVQIPVGYFHFFGREQAGVAHAVLGIALHAIPTVLLVASGILAAERVWPSRGPLKWLPYALGMVSWVMLWEVVVSPLHMQSLGLQNQGALAVVQSYLNIPWWAVPVAAAPWCGVALAAVLLRPGQAERLRGVA